MSIYKIPKFGNVDEFLMNVANVRGKLKKGGVVDSPAAARIVLHDWNEGMLAGEIHLTIYSLRPKMIVSLPGFFGPKTILWFICPARNLRYKVKYFCAKLSISRGLLTPQLPGAFWSSCCFLFEESYLQLLGQWSAGLNLAKVRNMDNHFGTEGVLFIGSFIRLLSTRGSSKYRKCMWTCTLQQSTSAAVVSPNLM